MQPYKQSGRWQDVPDTPILSSTRLLRVCSLLDFITEVYHDARFKKRKPYEVLITLSSN